MGNLMDFENIDKKKIVIGAVILVLFFVLVSLLNSFIRNHNDKKALEQAIVALGEKVYQEGYYDNLKKEPKEYEKEGIKITLNDMFKIVDLNSGDYFYNRKTNRACDINNSYVKIFPESPYGVKDYRISFVLDCGY